ncbi:MAG: hypothetical protein CL678_10525 [Bdellovibrionaceae bacterium]|nr:hypothetical protein [Pseudobdellovibrionaceae bacterium]
MNFRLNSPPTDQPPSVLQYVDVHEFLKDVYQFRKNKELDFSYLTWSKELGFKSRTFLQLVVTGKRKITDKSLSSFITGLSLKKKRN